MLVIQMPIYPTHKNNADLNQKYAPYWKKVYVPTFIMVETFPCPVQYGVVKMKLCNHTQLIKMYFIKTIQHNHQFQEDFQQAGAYYYLNVVATRKDCSFYLKASTAYVILGVKVYGLYQI